MKLWELVARESIRDLVARYNANGDAGRFDDVLALFAPDARLEVVSDRGTETYDGHDGIRRMLMSTRTRWTEAAAEGGAPPYVRHFVTTHQIDVVSDRDARGRSYVAVIKAHGLDSWGRYIDEYAARDGQWLFSYRKAISDRTVHDLGRR